ncbi:MAG: RagB/SusD family nutrient uptake outer membrane protein [Rikenellaceae bacterium]
MFLKSLNKTLLSAFAIASMMSCSEKLAYSEVTAYDEVEVFASFQRVNNYVTNLYSKLENGLLGYDSGGTLASACDEAVFAWVGSSVNIFTNGTWSATKYNSTVWSNAYYGINAVNFYLENWTKYDFAEYRFNTDFEDQIERYYRYQYEARFIRAYLYFELVKTYGDAPLYTENLSIEEANSVARTPAREIFEFIDAECEAISGKLPNDYASITYAESGRITDLTILALRARAAMYAASPLFVEAGEDATELWYKAALTSKALLDAAAEDGKCLDSYANLSGASNFQSSDVIYARRLGTLNSIEYYNFPIGVDGGGSGNCPSQTLVDAYRMQSTGLLSSEEGSGFDPANPYEGRDPRFAQTIVYNGTATWPNWNTNPIETFDGGINAAPTLGATPTGYYLRKFVDPSVDLRTGKVTTAKHSWIMYRVGEFYLNYAEAVANYFQDPNATDAEFETSAVAKLNELKAYRAIPTVEAADMATFNSYYRNERMVELAFEAHRFWDVRRWMIGSEEFDSVDVAKITKTNGVVNYDRATIDRNWEEKMNFFPIPNSEIMKNTNLVQNTGW